MIPGELLAVWRQPRQTIAGIVARDPAYLVLPLTALAGMAKGLDRAVSKNIGDKLDLPVVLLLAVFLGAMSGLVMLWLFSHLIRWTGEWIGGVAGVREIRTAMAWSSVPVVATLPIWVFQLLLLGKELFTEDMPSLDAHPWLWAPYGISILVELVLGVWSAWLFCQTVAEVQKFPSAWKGLLNGFLAIAVFMAPIILLAIGAVLFIGAHPPG